MKVILFALCAFSSLSANTVDVMRQEIASLADKPYAFVDLGISHDERSAIEKLHIEEQDVFNFYGDPSNIKAPLTAFIATLGANTDESVQAVTQVIMRIACSILKAGDNQACWLTVRTNSTPNDIFDMPRWHQDDYYFSPFSGFAYKFAAALQGSPTLFYPLPITLNNEFQEHVQDREYLTRMLDPGLVITPPKGMGAFFIVGDNMRSAVHSEPPMHEPRLFFSVVPGSHEQIQELQIRFTK